MIHTYPWLSRTPIGIRENNKPGLYAIGKPNTHKMYPLLWEELEAAERLGFNILVQTDLFDNWVSITSSGKIIRYHGDPRFWKGIPVPYSYYFSNNI